MKQLEFKKYIVGNFYIDKICREYSEDAIKQLPDTGQMRDIKKALCKADGIPYIVVGDRAGIWRCELIIGCDAYFFFDTCEVENGEIVDTVVEQILCSMYASCCILGDVKLFFDRQTAVAEYMDRIEKSLSNNDSETKSMLS